MLFARLIELQRAQVASLALAEAAGASALAHAALIVGWLVLHRDVERVVPAPDTGFTPVEYLVPRDRLPAMRPQREAVTWATLETASGRGFAQPVQEEATPPQRELEIVVPRGKESEIEAAMQEFQDQPPLVLGDSIMTELQVDSAVVRYEGSAAPAYPESLLRRRIEGSVLVQYVVDTMGRADTSTFRVVSTTHAEFARAVKLTLPSMRFRPAMMANRRVPQLVQQPFAFKIVDTSRARLRPPPEGRRLAVPLGDELPVRGPAPGLTRREVVE